MKRETDCGGWALLVLGLWGNDRLLREEFDSDIVAFEEFAQREAQRLIETAFQKQEEG
jgi:hypothetical protein